CIWRHDASAVKQPSEVSPVCTACLGRFRDKLPQQHLVVRCYCSSSQRKHNWRNPNLNLVFLPFHSLHNAKEADRVL
ncbi:uncharacterized protein METZ01_LOCUS448849, partial [marine metagenome]